MGRRLEVVPDSERVEQRLLDESLVTPFVDARGVCTLSQVVEACEPSRWSCLAPASPLLVRAHITEAAPLAERAFGPVARGAEFAAQVHALLSQLRTQAATAQQLLHAASQASAGLGARLGALAELWTKVDAALAARGQVDPGGLVAIATERLLAEGLPPRLAQVSSIVVRFLHELSPARLRFLEALATACHRAGVAFELWWPASGEPSADVFVLDAVRQVEARWQALDAEAFPEVADSSLGWVGAAAFASAPVKRAAPGLSLFSAASVREEAREIARRVRLLVNDGAAPEGIAVVLRDLAPDTERLVEALADVGVPARARLGVPLPASPVGRVALGLLELADDDFPAEAVAALLESRYVTLLADGAAPPRRTFAEAGARDDALGAAGSRGAYEVRLAAHQARLQRPEAEGDVGVSRGSGVRGERSGEREARQSRRDAASAVGLLREAVARLLAIVRSVPDEAPAAVLLEAFWQAVQALGLLDALARADGAHADGLLGRELERAVARDQASGEALTRLVADVRTSLRDSGLGRRVMRRRDFARWLRHAAAEENLYTRGPRTAAVALLDAREIAGRRFQHVFLAGLIDGRFPGRAPPQPLLSDAERGVVNQLAGAPLFRLGVADGELRLPARLAEDRLLFHLVLASASTSATLSRPRFDDAGRELLGSPFLDGVRQVVEGVEEPVLPRTSLPSLDAAVTEAELRARVALEVLCPGGTRQTPADARREALAVSLRGEPWLEEARRVAAAEAERLTFFSEEARPAGPFSGQVSPPDEVLGRLAFPAERPASAAELNAWGQCAFRGLGLYVLGLKGPEASGEEPDARVDGTFLHAVLELLLPALRAEGLLRQAKVDDATLTRHVDAAVRVAAQKTQARSPTGHPELWGLRQERTARLVRRLVQDGEVLLPFGAVQTVEPEQRFGEERDNAPGLERVPLPATLEGEREVFVRGRVDRVDLRDELVGVVDYKSKAGGRGELAEALLVADFQLPLYLWALRQQQPGKALAGAWVGVKERRALRVEGVLEAREGDVATLLATAPSERRRLADEGRPNLLNAVHGLLARLRTGDFGARATSCRHCDLKAVCRISTRKLGDEESEP
jgi:ATP-dependent helicase/nuclease subunit B